MFHLRRLRCGRNCLDQSSTSNNISSGGRAPSPSLPFPFSSPYVLNQFLFPESVYAVSNSTNGNQTRVTYASNLVNTATNTSQGSLQQSYTFSTSGYEVILPQQGSTLAVPAAAIKWNIVINASSTFSNGISLTFLLSDLSSLSATNASNIITRSDNTSTTYYLPLAGKTQVAVLENLNEAVIDGVLASVGHSLILLTTNSSGGGGGGGGGTTTVYSLVLQFPPFSSSIDYDPLLNMGTLFGQQHESRARWTRHRSHHRNDLGNHTRCPLCISGHFGGSSRDDHPFQETCQLAQVC